MTDPARAPHQLPMTGQHVAGETVAERYDVLRSLGRGAFGHTLLVRDRVENREIALKVLDPVDPERGDEWKARELLEREATVLGGLRHQSIPAIHGTFVAEWQGKRCVFLSMEFIEGAPLMEMIESGQSIGATELLQLFLALLGVLEYLHGRVPPILHRDIKPANIVVRPDGSPVLVDFGSVRHVFLASDEAGSTIAGTYGYMPYEQYMGQAAPSSDLYALAATFLHLITGRPPREFMNEEGRIAVPEALPCDPRLRAVITRMLQPSPANRYASARDARSALLSSSTALTQVSDKSIQRQSRADNNISGVSAPDSNRVIQRSDTDRLDPRVRKVLSQPVPRAIDFGLMTALDVLTPSMWDYMGSRNKLEDRVPFSSYLSLLLVAVVTGGTYPISFAVIARSRRTIVTRFLQLGVHLQALVVRIESEEMAFSERISRAYFTFEYNGETKRDSDRVLLATANHWVAGDTIDILYIPVYDEAIVVSNR